MALDPNKKFLYFNKDASVTESDEALCFPVSRFIGIETRTSSILDFYFEGSKGVDATTVRVFHNQYAYIKTFMSLLVNEINFGEKAFIKVYDHAEKNTHPSDISVNMGTDVTPVFTLEDATIDLGTVLSVEYGGTGASTLTADGVLFGNGTSAISAVDLSTNGNVIVGGSTPAAVTGANLAGAGLAATVGNGTLVLAVETLNQDTTGTAAIATSVTVADESTDTTCFPLFSTAATGDLSLKSGTNLTFNSNTGLLTCISIFANGFTGDLTGDVLGDVEGNVEGNADTATTLATPRAIFGHNFDGSAALTGVIASANLDADTAHLTTTQTFSGAKTFSANAALAGIIMDGNTITGVDDSGEFTDDDAHIMTSAGINDRFAQINADTTGNADTATLAADATTLATPRAINGVDFDGSAAITVTAAGSTLSDTVTVAKGGTGLTTVADTTILTGNGTSALESEANLTFGGNRLTIGNNSQDIQPYIRMFNDENTLELGIANSTNDFVPGSADGDVVMNSFGDHNVIIGQNDVAALTIDTNGDSNFNRRFTVTGDTDGTYEGDVVYFGGTTSMTVGTIYHYKSDGTWEAANANAVATSDGLLAVALGAASDTSGMLLRGMVTLDHDPGAVGDVLFLSNTAGDASATAPSDNNDIVRVIGYCLHASNGQIWFNPDNTFVEVTA